MNGIDYMIIGVIAVILCAAAFAVYKSKKSGRKCIGCPEGCGNCSGCAGACAHKEE